GEVGPQQAGRELPDARFLAAQALAEEGQGPGEVLAVRLHRVLRGVLLDAEVTQEVGQRSLHDNPFPGTQDCPGGAGSFAPRTCSCALRVSTAASNQFRLRPGSAAWIWRVLSREAWLSSS